MEEELVAKDRAISEANQRLARLEKTIKDLQGLLAVRNKDLSEFQDRAAISDSSNSETIALESDNGAEIEVIADAEESVDAEEVPALEVALFRFVIQTLLLAPFVIYKFGIYNLWPDKSLIHFIRGALIGLCSLTFFAALKVMPIADAVAIFFVEPLILTLISAIFSVSAKNLLIN